MQGSKLPVTGAEVQPVGASEQPDCSFVHRKSWLFCPINGSAPVRISSANDHIKRHQAMSFLYPLPVGTPSGASPFLTGRQARFAPASPLRAGTPASRHFSLPLLLALPGTPPLSYVYGTDGAGALPPSHDPLNSSARPGDCVPSVWSAR
jgi:hypothetical protein